MRDLIEFLWSSTTLALRGALLQDLWGTGGPLWLATLAGGLIGGALSPYLLRNIKIA